MRKYSIFICVMVALLLCAGILGKPVQAEKVNGGYCGENLTWEMDETGLVTISGTGPMYEYGKYDSPWHDSSKVTGVVVEEGVTTVSAYAFRDCDYLTSAVLADSVTVIGEYAFKGCNYLKQLDMGEGVQELGQYAFANCSALQYYTGGENLQTIGSYAFEYSDLHYIVIGNTLETAGEGIFSGAYWLVHVFFRGSEIQWQQLPIFQQIPEKVTVHYSCTGPLVEEPQICNVEGHLCRLCGDCIAARTVYDRPHSYVKGVCSVCGVPETFHYTRDDLGLCLGEYTGMDDRVVIPETVNGLPVTWIGEYAFDFERHVKEVVLPAHLRGIGRYAFEGCTGLTEIEIPDSVTDIEGMAFFQCNNLTTVRLGSGMEYLADAFPNCKKLTTLFISGSSLKLNNIQFKGCDSLNHVFYSGTREQMEAAKAGVTKDALADAVWHCDTTKETLVRKDSCGFTVYYCPLCEENTAAIPKETVSHSFLDGACSTCGTPEGLQYGVYKNGVVITGYTGNETEMILPERLEGLLVLDIGERAFYKNERLKSVVIPDTVQRIQEQAFHYATALETVVIGDGVTEIADSAFNRCKALRTFKMGKNVETLGRGVFFECPSLKSMYLGDSMRIIGDSMFFSYSSLRSVILPATVERIGSWFAEDSLTDIYYMGTEEQWAQVDIGQNNEALLKATVHFNATGDIPGDMDGDMMVTDGDAVYLLRHTLFPESYPIFKDGDVNKDGTVTDGDAVYLLRHTLFPEDYPLP